MSASSPWIIRCPIHGPQTQHVLLIERAADAAIALHERRIHPACAPGCEATLTKEVAR